jgi:hypothetical protein
MTTYQCGCGRWTGERCCWTGSAEDMVVVQWMPEYLRESHAAAGNSGCWGHNGSERVAVERSCASLLIEGDGDYPGDSWAHTVAGVNPETYAEEV